MPKKIDNENQIVNIDTDIVEVSKESSVDISMKNIDDLKKDYEYTRANLYSLVEKGQEAINGILELAAESDSPRVYEVAFQGIKNIADVTDKLADLQKKIKDIEEDSVKTSTNVTNNALFVGSTAELSKLLKDGFLNNKE
jgi:hypothetical protein